MTRTPARLTRWSAAALLAMAGTALAAPGDNGSILPDGDNTKNLTKPGVGGVAGTGLGGSTGSGGTSGKPAAGSGAPGLPGTGTSVKGPAGEGIGGEGRSDGITAGTGGK